MRISHFFIDRPIFAAVVSIVFVILGGVAFSRLPIAQYPEIAPPIINVTGQYPGASAEVVASTVVTPMEQQINGVENMLYMSSNSTADGRFSIQVTFDLGTNLDIAQVQVQNRVAIAQPRLPADVRNIGVTVTKSSPDLMMVVHLYSPDKSRDALFISNYATLEVTDPLTRVDGVGSITVFGSRDYSMRIWLDPDRLQSLGLTATDVTNALQAQNIQVASGVLDQPPVAHPGAFQIAVQTLGRLDTPAEFGNIVVKETPGAVVRLRDIADIQLAALDYSSNSYLDHDPAVALAIFQRPGSNALDTAKGVVDLMAKLSQRFPPGVKYAIVYNPTQFIQQSVDAVIDTIGEAIVLVVLVVVLFLQTWRAALIPLVAIPVSLIGSFFFMAAFGFTLNNLSLFGLVLAIGIVVDDAIVVVENVERNIAAGLPPREAARKSMDEVGSALVAIALVLCAVFVPSIFITGISGQFYRQFALTITGATVISLIVSLTLSPAMCALLLRPHQSGHRDRWWERPIYQFFGYFNRGFDQVGFGISWLATRTVRRAVMMAAIYLVVIALGLNAFRTTPVGFIPQVDRGYIIVVVQLPPGASLARTDAVQQRALDIALSVPGVVHAVNIVGFSGATFTNAPNSGALFLVLDDYTKRGHDPRESAAAIQEQLNRRLSVIQDAFIISVLPPPVMGIGNAGGFRMMVEDRSGQGSEALRQATELLVLAAVKTPGIAQAFSLFETSTPQVYLDIDRIEAQLLGVNVQDVFNALQVYIGSSYVNDFNLFGRTFRVMAQARDEDRQHVADVLQDQGAQFQRRYRTARLLHHRGQHRRSLSRAALQSLSDRRGRRRRRAGLFAGPGDRDHGQARRCDAAGRIRHRVDDAGLSADQGRQYRHVRVRTSGGLRLSGAGGPIRESDFAAGRDHDRADVSGRRHYRRHPARSRQQHPHPGRLRGADRSGGEECDPDRRVCPPIGRSRAHALGGRRRGDAAAAAADPDDLVRLHPRRDAFGLGNRRRRGTAPGARHRGVLRHDRGDGVRPDLHAGVLCYRPLHRPTRTAARQGRPSSVQPAE